MRGGTSAEEHPGEPRRSKRQRIDLTSEEGFDRHELERALRQSLEEERLREKEKPTRKTSKPKEEKVSPKAKEEKPKLPPKPASRQPVKKRKTKDSESEAHDSGEEERKSGAKKTKTSPPNRRSTEQKKAPAVKKEKSEPAKRAKEEDNKTETAPTAVTKAKKVAPVKKSEEAKESPKKEEKKEDIATTKETKPEESSVKQTNPKKPIPKEKTESPKKKVEEKEAVPAAHILTKEGNSAVPAKEGNSGDTQKSVDKPEAAEAPRLQQPYRIPSRASDLITLLACAKEVLGDHEYTSDHDISQSKPQDIMRLLLLSLSFIFSLVIFQSGFLLKRKELHMRSKCSDAKLPQSECWMQRQFKKVVVLLIDALRYDFMLPPEVESPRSFFRGHMPGVKKLLKRGARIGLLLADPPTTTLQRIKAITTGTLPTFIDAGDNFAPSAIINEDNVFYQAHTKHLNVSFMGDSTWTSLYPDMFTQANPYDSFDINDLNTVDTAVKELLRNEMTSHPSADLVVAHVLGIDHCGHKYGPNHVQMTVQLRKVDEIILETADELRNDDLLVVLGDHGMTSTGDHGGDSDDETHAGLLVYSPGHELPPLPNSLRQIDLVPTLSLLLGLPIPFSNLGIVIESLFPSNLTEQAVALNYEQIRRFASTYASANPSFEISEIIARDTSNPAEQLRTMHRLQDSLRAAWTQFNLPMMRLGILSIVEALFFVLSLRSMSAAQAVVRSGCLLLQLSVIFGGCNENPAVPLLLAVLPLSILFSLISVISVLLTRRLVSYPMLFGYVCVLLHSVSYLSNSYVVYEAHVVRFLIQSILLVCAVAKAASSSCHRKTVAHAMSSPIQAVISTFSMWETGILFASLVLLRSEPIFHRCREEEVNCEQYLPLELVTSLSSDAIFWRFVLATTVIYSLNYVVGRILPNNLPGSVRIARSLSWSAHAFITLYHLAQLTPHTETLQKQIQMLSIALALSVYAISMLAVLMCACARDGPSRVIYLCLAHTICWPLMLLLGDGLQPSLIAFLIILYGVSRFCSKEALPPLLSLLAPFGFYLTGHSPTLPTIPWQAAFVGVPGNFSIRAVPAFLILTHICVSAILVPFSLPLHMFASRESVFSLVGCSAISSLFSCLAATIHRRHLMVWKIFAPRFIFEGVLFIYFLVAVNLTLFISKRLRLL